MVLADESNLYKQQLKFDEKALENYYLLGGTGSLSDNVEQFVVMDLDKEFADMKGVLNNLAEAVKLKDIEMYMAEIDPSAPGYKDTRDVYTEVFAALTEEQVNIEAIYESIDMMSMTTKEAKVKAVENDKITYKDPETGEDVAEEELYTMTVTFKKVNGKWKIYESEIIEE
ncbi:hypothetical protein SDC9_197321 [bioreactor metagenome]|uniref:Uncharacterized protein n=1 Tax=bioreactor metagenome TaxID=1076179 RepID=A0A645IGV6_9ZZZZ